MKAIDAAKYIIQQSNKNNKPVSNLQVQKLLYFAHANSDATLIEDDFEAWKNGPVVREVYNELKINGAEKITNTQWEEVKPTNDEQKILDKTIKQYKNCGAWDMVKISHSKGGAWRKTANDYINEDGSWNEQKYKENYIKNGVLKIDNELIKQDKNKLENNEKTKDNE